MGQGWRTGAPGSALSSTAADAAQLLRHMCQLCQAEVTSCSQPRLLGRVFLAEAPVPHPSAPLR